MRPASIAAAAALLVVLAAALLPRLSLAPYPRLLGPEIVVEAALPGAGRDEVLARFTAPLERRLLGLPAVDGVDSWTADGAARLRVRARAGGDGERLRLAVTQRLAEVELRPADLRVELLPADERPLLGVAVVGAGAAARTAFVRSVLVPELAHAGGSERIDVVGAAPLRVVVEPLQAALAARGLTTGDLVARLRRVGVTRPVGRVREGALPRQLVVGEEVTGLLALRELRLSAPGGDAVLRDVATVSLRPLGDGDAFTLDGRPAVLVRLFAERRANAAVAGWRLRRSLDALAARLPAGLGLRVVDDAGAAAMRALLRAAFGALTAGIAAGAYLAWRRRGWRRVGAAISIPPLALLTAIVAAALLGAALDPVGLAVLAATAGGLAFPALLWMESGATDDASAEAGRARRPGGGVGLALRPAAGARPGRPSSPALAPLLLALTALWAAAVGWWMGAATTSGAGSKLEVRYALAPDLPAAERVRRGERLATALVRALPVRPREWSSLQPRPPGVDSCEPHDGVLRLAFAGRRDARLAGDAARRWLAARSEARARVDLAPRGWLAGLDEAAIPTLWAIGPTAAARQASLARAGATLRRELPSAVLVAPPPAGTEWRLTPRPRQSAAGWSDDLASGLGGVDAGAVRIAGVEPAIRLASPVEAEGRLGLLAVRSQRASARGGVVPLAVAATVRRVPRSRPLVRHDGAPAEQRSLLGADAAQLSRQARRLAGVSGGVSPISLAGGAAALARRSAELGGALAVGALLVLAVLVGATGSIRTASIPFVPVAVAWGGAWAGASLAGGDGAGPTVTLALLTVTPLAALAVVSSRLRRAGDPRA